MNEAVPKQSEIAGQLSALEANSSRLEELVSRVSSAYSAVIIPSPLNNSKPAADKGCQSNLGMVLDKINMKITETLDALQSIANSSAL